MYLRRSTVQVFQPTIAILMPVCYRFKLAFNPLTLQVGRTRRSCEAIYSLKLLLQKLDKFINRARWCLRQRSLFFVQHVMRRHFLQPMKQTNNESWLGNEFTNRLTDLTTFVRLVIKILCI